MDEKLVQQVLEIEKQAEVVHDEAVKQAEELPAKAEEDAQALIEKSRSEAEEEARQMIAKAQSEEEGARILAQAEEKIKETESLAKSNFDRAVSHVLNRVIGGEQK